MSSIEYTQKDWPSADQFMRQLRESAEQYDPVEKLLSLERKLASLEQTYGLSSDEFYQRYQTGQMGDDLVFVTWAGQYRLYVNLRDMISNGLRMVATERYVA